MNAIMSSREEGELSESGGTRGSAHPMMDSFGRRIDYVRMSITDRCDLRCRYCMPERMEFLPRKDLLDLEEVVALADVFIARGVKRIRLTGGEPLIRKGFAELVARLGQRLDLGLEELTITTNGTQLAAYADHLAASGVRRVNVSLDTLKSERYREITRRGNIEDVLSGIAKASAAGLRIKINMVALASINDAEIEAMLKFCIASDHDLTLIETMPLGDTGEVRAPTHLPLARVEKDLKARFGLTESAHATPGPARYLDVPGSTTRIGFITPLTQNFCASCNRIRVTATGTVYGCLGRDQKVELREAWRTGGKEAVMAALDRLLAGKPKGHEFAIEDRNPAVSRFMSTTGG